MHTVRNRSALTRSTGSRKGKAVHPLPQCQPPFLLSDPAAAPASLHPVFPASVHIAPRRGAVINSVLLPAAQAAQPAEVLLVLPAAVSAKTPRKKKAARKTKNRKGLPRKAAASRKTTVLAGALPDDLPAIAQSAKAAEPAAPPRALPVSPVQPLSSREPQPPLTPLVASRAPVRTAGGGVVARLIRWLDACSSALIGQPLARKRRRAPLAKARQALPTRKLPERASSTRWLSLPETGAVDELLMLRLENDRLNRELRLLKAAARDRRLAGVSG